MRTKQMMIAEAIEFFVGPIFAVNDERLMFGNVVGFAEIFENRGNFGLKTLSKHFAPDIFVFVVATGQNIERALAVTGLDAFEAIDFHFLEKRAAFCQFVAKKRRVGVFGIDRFPATDAPAEADDD